MITQKDDYFLAINFDFIFLDLFSNTPIIKDKRVVVSFCRKVTVHILYNHF